MAVYPKGTDEGNVLNSEFCFGSSMRTFAQSGHIPTVE